MDFILDVYVGWCLFFCFSLEIGCTGMKSEILSIKIKCIKNREKEKWKMNISAFFCTKVAVNSNKNRLIKSLMHTHF